MTRPFICGASPYGDLLCEGDICGEEVVVLRVGGNRLVNLALPNAPLGLPMFKMAEASLELIKGSERADIRDLGVGSVFASRRIEGAQELTWSSAQGWPEETMAMLLLIDLWIQNEDRSLSELGGNPNLLVEQIAPLSSDDPEGALWANQPRRKMLWAFDFNLALDEDFSRARFFELHVFGGMLKSWPESFRERMEPQFNESVRIRESVFRFGEVRTILTSRPKELNEELFRRYVRMEETATIN